MQSMIAEPSPIPTIMCPVCGSRMRLSTILPEEDHHDRMTFICECGFDYRQSTAAATECTL